ADQPVTYRADALGGQRRGRLRMMLGDPGTAGAFRLTNHLIHRPEGIVQVEGDQFQSSHRESESSGLIGAAGYPLSPINPPCSIVCLALGAWMDVIVEPWQMLEIQVGIDLGGAEIGVAEQLLHRAQVAGGFEQVGGVGMAQLMRVQMLAKAPLN